MILHSILAEKFNRPLKHPAPDYSGLSPLQRVRAMCAAAKRQVAARKIPRRKAHCYGPNVEECVNRSRVGHTGWTSLGLRSGAQ